MSCLRVFPLQAASMCCAARNAAEPCCVANHVMAAPPALHASKPALLSVSMDNAEAGALTCVRPVQSPASGSATIRCDPAYTACCRPQTTASRQNSEALMAMQSWPC